MPKHTSENLRIKRRYLVWLKDAEGLSDASIDKAAAAIDLFDGYARGRSFKSFHMEQARGFKRHLERARHQRTGNLLSASTIDGTLRELRGFFRWLADQPGYKSRIRHSDAAYFSPAQKLARQAQARGWKPHPTPEQIEHVLRTMPTATVLERRNRAIIATLYLTGSRDAALVSLRLRHIDLVEGCVHFDGREVRTKFAKTFTTWFFPVSEQARQIVEDWIRDLREVHLWGPEDPLFPKARMAVDHAGKFTCVGVERVPLAGAGQVRKIFPAAFRDAGLPQYNPHRIRDTLVALGSKLCKTPEQVKAWSQNLGHSDVMTTFRNYGTVAPGRQGEILKALGQSED